jgi:hypothetical protein
MIKDTRSFLCSVAFEQVSKKKKKTRLPGQFFENKMDQKQNIFLFGLIQCRQRAFFIDIIGVNATRS